MAVNLGTRTCRPGRHCRHEDTDGCWLPAGFGVYGIEACLPQTNAIHPRPTAHGAHGPARPRPRPTNCPLASTPSLRQHCQHLVGSLVAAVLPLLRRSRLGRTPLHGLVSPFGRVSVDPGLSPTRGRLADSRKRLLLARRGTRGVQTTPPGRRSWLGVSDPPEKSADRIEKPLSTLGRPVQRRSLISQSKQRAAKQ